MSNIEIYNNEKLLRFIIVPKNSPNVNFDDERKYKTFVFKKDIRVGDLKGLIFKKTNLKMNITMNPLDDLSIQCVPKCGLYTYDDTDTDTENVVNTNEINICMMNNNNSIYDMFDSNRIKSGYCFQVIVNKQPKTNESLNFLSDSITKVNSDALSSSLFGNIGTSLISGFSGFAGMMSNNLAIPVINPVVASSVYTENIDNASNTNNEDNFEYMWEDEDTSNSDFIVW